MKFTTEKLGRERKESVVSAGVLVKFYLIMIPTSGHLSNRPFRSIARWVGLSILIVCTTLGNANGADSGRAKRVMMISTGSRFSPGFALIEQSALDTMAKLGPDRIDFYSEYLDIIRFPSESYQRIFRDYLRDKYADNPPDLLMLFYVGNLGIAATLLQQLFRGSRSSSVALPRRNLPPIGSAAWSAVLRKMSIRARRWN